MCKNIWKQLAAGTAVKGWPTATLSHFLVTYARGSFRSHFCGLNAHWAQTKQQHKRNGIPSAAKAQCNPSSSRYSSSAVWPKASQNCWNHWKTWRPPKFQPLWDPILATLVNIFLSSHLMRTSPFSTCVYCPSYCPSTPLRRAWLRPLHSHSRWQLQ